MFSVTRTREPIDRRIVQHSGQPVGYHYHRNYRTYSHTTGQSLVIALVALGLITVVGTCLGIPSVSASPRLWDCVTYEECDHFFGESYCHLVEECIPF